MLSSISDIIYQAFFEQLTTKDNVKPETIESLRKILGANQIPTKQSLALFAKELELRYAQNKISDSK